LHTPQPKPNPKSQKPKKYIIMGGCASRPKESDMQNEEGSVPNKPVSENVVAKVTINL